MADVGKVNENKSGPSPEGPKRKKGHDPDRFKEMMKSGKVRETDPEEQRKRKSQAEREEEEIAEMTTAQPSTEEKMIMPSPGQFDVKVPESADAVGPTEEPSAAKAPSSPPPAEESDESTPGVDTAKSTPSTPRQPKTSRGKVEKSQQPDHKKKATEETPKAKLPPKEKKELEKLPKTPEEEAVQPPPPPLAQGAWEATEDLERGEEKLVKKVAPIEKESPTSPTTFQTPPPPATAPPIAGEPVQPVTAPFANLPAPVAALFERMVGVMTVMNTTGVTQTTIHLDNPKFADSPLFGSQVIISEFSTAPKAYNIQLLGNQQAVTVFNDNVQELVAAFQAGNYTFKVNRIDTGYLTAAPPVERKREARRVKRKRGAE